MNRYGVRLFVISVFAALMSAGCNTVDDSRLPAMPVTINLSDAGLWNKYGVSGFGTYRYFIPQLHLPSGFSYTVTTYTGFGGVLLIGGMDPYTTTTETPLAYDLACPVECSADIRVAIDISTYEAVCPVCGSHYDVTMAGGAPTSGPALEGKHKYGMTRYQCLQSTTGGYMITR